MQSAHQFHSRILAFPTSKTDYAVDLVSFSLAWAWNLALASENRLTRDSVRATGRGFPCLPWLKITSRPESEDARIIPELWH